MKSNRYYYVAQGRDIPPNTKVFKSIPNETKMIKPKLYILTNEYVITIDDKTKLSQTATKMLYLIDEDQRVHFVPFDEYFIAGFDTLDEMQENLDRVKNNDICGKTEKNRKKVLPWIISTT